MKGKQRSLNGLFWRYLLSTMALLAGVLLALWFVLLQLIRMGAVLPADTGARNLERTTVPVSYTHLDVYKRQAIW